MYIPVFFVIIYKYVEANCFRNNINLPNFICFPLLLPPIISFAN